MSDMKALHDVPLRDVYEGEADVLCPTCRTRVHVVKKRFEKEPATSYVLSYSPSTDLVGRSVVDGERLKAVADRDAEWEPLRAKHAALFEAAKAVRIHVGVLHDHPLGWECSVCGSVADEGHLPSCAWYRFVTAIADLEASDD